MVSWDDEDFADAPDVFWEQDARTDRDEWDLHLRHVDEDERDRRERDVGELGPKGAPA